MVYGFVRQSGGQIIVESELSQGTSVRLYLPRTLELPRGRVVEAELTGQPSRPARVLVVEDDPNVRAIVTSVVRGQGYDVVEAVTGREALEVLGSDQSFDILFTDVMLPGGLTGAKVAEEAVILQPNIKVLFTSGYSKDALISEGKLKQGVRLIRKPYRSAVLVSEIEAVLGN
jgi:CheY-like chemotaxis protein